MVKKLFELVIKKTIFCSYYFLKLIDTCGIGIVGDVIELTVRGVFITVHLLYCKVKSEQNNNTTVVESSSTNNNMKLPHTGNTFFEFVAFLLLQCFIAIINKL